MYFPLKGVSISQIWDPLHSDVVDFVSFTHPKQSPKMPKWEAIFYTSFLIIAFYWIRKKLWDQLLINKNSNLLWQWRSLKTTLLWIGDDSISTWSNCRQDEEINFLPKMMILILKLLILSHFFFLQYLKRTFFCWGHCSRH